MSMPRTTGIWAAVRALAWRDVCAFLRAPSGWVVLALFTFGSSLVFMAGVFHAGRPASLRFVLEFDAIFLMLAAPAVTMAAIGEERRRGTWALLRSTPVPTGALVGAKFLGAACIGLLMLLIPTLPQVALLEAFGRPDLGEVACGLLGVYLLTLCVMASGLLASALTGGATTAFLITALSWVLAVVVLEMALPAVVSPAWAPLIAAVDPLHRLQAFTQGLFDSANVAYFVGLSTLFLWSATVMARPGRRRMDMAGLAGLAVAVIAAITLAGADAVQVRTDATKSRRYSLSPRTSQLLTGLKGDWSLAVLLVEQRADPALLRQVDEVLDRYADAADNLSVRRIDPTSPAAVLDFESLLEQLRIALAADTALWDSALDEGQDVLANFVLFAQQRTAHVRAIAALADEPQLAEALGVRAGALALLGAEGTRLLDAVEQARTPSAVHPLADRGSALAILTQVLGQWAEESDGIARLLSVVDPADQSEMDAWKAQAATLAAATDRLRRLPASELAGMGVLLAQGEAAVVIGPGGAAVVPANQLLPTALSAGNQGVAMDQRFRGDQVLAAAIRSLQDGVQPRVVMVHAEPESVLGGGGGPADLSGPAAMLRASRVEVQEWTPGGAEQPQPWTAGPTAWVVVPTIRSGGLKPTDEEQALLQATKQLLAAGENVMINLNPSLSPRYGQEDPWAKLLKPLGVRARTGEVLLQSVPANDGGRALSTSVQLADFPEPHLIAEALHGQDLVLPMPVPVDAMDDRAMALAARHPDEGVWVEDDWRSLTMGRNVQAHRLPRFDEAKAPEQAVPLVAAVELDGPRGDQRVLVIGSGTWLRTSVADQAVSAGAGRVALAHPGNHELLLAGTAWLSHLDDRIAAGPLSQEVARLGAISRGVRRTFGWLLLGGMPLVLLACGSGITLARRDA